MNWVCRDKYAMKFLVVGLGSIGKRHVQNLKKVSTIDMIAYRTNKREDTGQEDNIKTYYDFREALDQAPDAVLVTNPTSEHIAVALEAAKRGCHLFIEKPISYSLDGVNELVDIAGKKNLAVLIGYNLRFHPSLRLIKQLLEGESIGKIISARVQVGQYLPDWHPEEDYRKLYTARASLGGGVILDLSHEIDYTRWFLGEIREVFAFCGKLSNLVMDTEDTAEVLLRFKSGAIAEVHLDCVQRSYSRSCQIIGEEGTILWDFNEKQVRVFSAKDKEWRYYPEAKGYTINEMYIEEMKHFIDCVEGKDRPIVDALEGKRTLEMALAAKEAARLGRTVTLEN